MAPRLTSSLFILLSILACLSEPCFAVVIPTTAPTNALSGLKLAARLQASNVVDDNLGPIVNGVAEKTEGDQQILAREPIQLLVTR